MIVCFHVVQFSRSCALFTEVNSFIISHCFQLVKHFFQSFLISFWNRSFNRNRLFLAYLWAFWALVRRCLADSSYIISCPNCFVNTFFEKNPDFFQKSGKSPLFPFFMRVFELFRHSSILSIPFEKQNSFVPPTFLFTFSYPVCYNKWAISFMCP